jgi:general secretion pathway protein D
MNLSRIHGIRSWLQAALLTVALVGPVDVPAQQPPPNTTPPIVRQFPTRARPGAGGALPVPPPPGAGGASTNAAEATGEPSMTPEEAAALGENDLVTLNLPNAPLESALDLYAGLIHRVLLRPPQLAGGPINLKFEDLTRDEAIEAMNAVFALNSISVIPVGTKFVKVVPSQQAVQEGAKVSDLATDELSELGQFITKLVKVTKIKPGDIAQAVQQFASGKIQNPVLVFDDQNFFVLRDMAANVKRMSELIKELDVTPELDYKLEVIPIRYGKVDEIYDTLNSVITGSPSSGGSRSSSRLGGFRSGATTGAGGTGNTLGSQFSPQQNTLNRTGGMTSPGQARSSFSDRLRQVTSAATGGGGAQYNLLGDARIIPDERSNSLIVYAGKDDFKMLTNIVAKIDTLLAQVLIESIILEVGLEKGKDFGVSMVQRPQQFGNWSSAAGSVNDASIATNLLGNLFGGGFSYFGQYKDDFAVAITAIANDSNAKVLARPRIQTTHAQPAQFEIGDTVPYPQSSSPYYGGVGGGTGYAPYTTYQEKKVTTRLDVVPYITPDGLVTLEVSQVIDQLGPTTKVGNDEIPTIRTRSASAVLSVHDREPVILGGFITDRRTESNSGVPWLKDIPLLGWAFRSKTDFKQRSELIVLIRPTILNTPSEASKIAELEQRSLPNAAATVREFQRDEAEMAERLGVVPGSTNAPAVDTEKTTKSKSRKSRKN